MKHPIAYVFIAFTLISVYALADALPSSLAEAAKLADENEIKFAEYHKNTLMPYFGPKYARATNHCLATVHDPDRRSLTFVFVLDNNGRVRQTYRNLETNVFTCIRGQLSEDTFPAPPVAPYFAHFKIDFPK